MATFNVNGINIPAKRRAIFPSLREQNLDFYCLQETHSTNATIHLWQSEVFKELKHIFTDFIWNNRKPKIAYNTLIQPVADGGLNLFERTQAVKRMILRPHLRSAAYLKHIIKTDDLDGIFRTIPKAIPSTILRLPYYQNLFKFWYKIHNSYPSDETSIRKEPLWNNKWITTSNGPLQNYTWVKKGIGVLQDICHAHESRLLSHTELAEKFNVRCTFVDMLAIRLSIPLQWRQSLSDNWTPPPIFPGGPLISINAQDPQDITGISAKRAYTSVIAGKRGVNAAFHRWRQNPPNLAISDREEWSRTCLRIFKTVKETKLQSFQFKVIHAITPFRKYLRQLRLADDDLCAHCGTTDDLFHFFFECKLVQNLWSSICTWLAREANIQLLNITTKEAVLGFDDPSTEGRISNFILLHFRFFVHRQRLFHDNKLDLMHWLTELRTRLLTMKHNLKAEGKDLLFARWEPIFKALG